MKSKSFLFSAVFAFWFGTSAQALPLPKAGENLTPLFEIPQIASEADGEVDFTAIVGLSNCSGSFVRFAGSLGTDRGMVLTNGHCIGGGFLKPGRALADVEARRDFYLLSASGKETLATLKSDRLIYATMTTTDFAFYRLTQTYDEIEKQTGVKALTLANASPRVQDPIALISGYHKYLHACQLDALIYEMREDAWTWKSSLRYGKGCNSIPGSSGSPIVNRTTREVVGINNTHNDDGAQCTMDNPCEVDEKGKVTVNLHASYGQQTWLIYGCLDAKNQLNFTKKECALPKPTGR